MCSPEIFRHCHLGAVPSYCPMLLRFMALSSDQKSFSSSSTDELPFWKRKSINELSLDEWESLCDGCGKCCLHKLEDLETGEVSYTEVSCSLLDLKTCRCTDYGNRTLLISDCVKLTAENLKKLQWLPNTCAYKLVYEGKNLYWWHPLISGDPETVHQAGVSVRNRTVAEQMAGNLEDHIVEWPEKTTETSCL